MNINEMVLAFIESKDIAEHLKNIGYQFTLPEAAFLVHRSNEITLEGKFKAWEKIITDMPDCDFSSKHKHFDSFHKLLRDYIDRQKQLLEYFYRQDGSIYFYFINYAGVGNDYDRPYSSFTNCYSALKNELKKMNNFNVNEIYIKKQPIDEMDISSKSCELQLSPDLKEMWIFKFGQPKELYEISHIFSNMWFRFPTPFKEGDILINEDALIDTPFVFKSICDNGADTTDMCYSGYFVSDGRFFEENDDSYLSLEYYKEPLTDEYRFLRVISMYLKGECNLEFLLDAKDIIFGEKQIEECKKYLNRPDEIIKAVGIEK